MGIFSDTTVVNKNETTVENTVEVAVENVVDLSGIEQFLAYLRELFTAQNETSSQLLAGQTAADTEANTISRENLAIAIINAAAEVDKNAQLAEANKTFKQLSYGALALAALWIVFKE